MFSNQNVIFRFRSARALLEEYEELEKQEIYFCPYDSEDDIFEGIMDVYFKGDEIVWNSLFAQYMRLFAFYYAGFQIGMDEIPEELNYRLSGHDINADEMIDEFCGSDAVKEVISHIMTAENGIKEAELLFYLQQLHTVAVVIVVRYFLKDKVDLSDLPLMKVEVGRFAFGSDKEREDAFLKARRHQELLRQNFPVDKDAEEEPRKAALSFLMMRFPEMFVAMLTKMIMPNWYIASFCTDYKIPVVWSEYADGFKGVCLIFRTDESKASGHRGIRLFTSHSWSSEKGHIYEHHTETLHPVIYSQENVSFNFFEYLGSITEYQLREWTIDKQGNKSRYYIPEEKKEEWRQRYWALFYRLATEKEQSWKAQEEMRVILMDILCENYEDSARRKIKYDFADLQGVIFGPKIEAADRTKIMEILYRKCKENSRTDFEVYDSYQDTKNRKVEIYEAPDWKLV